MSAPIPTSKKPKLAVPLSIKTKMYLRLMAEEEESENKKKQQLEKDRAGWRYLKGLDDKMLIDTDRDILNKDV